MSLYQKLVGLILAPLFLGIHSLSKITGWMNVSKIEKDIINSKRPSKLILSYICFLYFTEIEHYNYTVISTLMKKNDSFIDRVYSYLRVMSPELSSRFCINLLENNIHHTLLYQYLINYYIDLHIFSEALHYYERAKNNHCVNKNIDRDLIRGFVNSGYTNDALIHLKNLGNKYEHTFVNSLRYINVLNKHDESLLYNSYTGLASLYFVALYTSFNNNKDIISEEVKANIGKQLFEKISGSCQLIKLCYYAIKMKIYEIPYIVTPNDILSEFIKNTIQLDQAFCITCLKWKFNYLSKDILAKFPSLVKQYNIIPVDSLKFFKTTISWTEKRLNSENNSDLKRYYIYRHLGDILFDKWPKLAMEYYYEAYFSLTINNKLVNQEYRCIFYNTLVRLLHVVFICKIENEKAPFIKLQQHLLDLIHEKTNKDNYRIKAEGLMLYYDMHKDINTEEALKSIDQAIYWYDSNIKSMEDEYDKIEYYKQTYNLMQEAAHRALKSKDYIIYAMKFVERIKSKTLANHLINEKSLRHLHGNKLHDTLKLHIRVLSEICRKKEILLIVNFFISPEKDKIYAILFGENRNKSNKTGITNFFVDLIQINYTDTLKAIISDYEPANWSSSTEVSDIIRSPFKEDYITSLEERVRNFV